MPQLFQVFKDNDNAKGYAQVIEGYNKEQLTKMNNNGLGIYRTPNEFDATEEERDALWEERKKTRPKSSRPTKRNTEFLKKLNYIYADIDFAKSGDGQSQDDINKKKQVMIKALLEKCEPTIIIDTKNGIQPLWKIDEDKVDEGTQMKYVNTINGIIERSRLHGGAGDAVKDCARVLRVPGFYHMKTDPYLCTSKNYSKEVYTLDQLSDLFPYEPKHEPVSNNTSKPNGIYTDNSNSMISSGDATLQFQEVDRIDIKELIEKAFGATGRRCEIDHKQRIILDGRLTGGFIGKVGDGQFIGSTSHEDFSGNRITATSKILGISPKEAYQRIIEKFGIPSESDLKKKQKPKIQRKDKPGSDKPKTFSEMKRKKFSMGNLRINVEIGHFWENEFVLIHGKSKNGKTYYTMSIANENGMPLEEGGYGHKVAFYSLEMDRKKLKTQQASIRSGISRLMFENEDFKPEQRDTYCTVYENFDKYFTIFDENDLGGDEGITLDNLLIQIEKQHLEDGFDMFIIDSLKLIGGQNMQDNAREAKIAKAIRKLKNKIPVCIVLIHHNGKDGKTFSGAQDLENFCDCRMEIKKKMDPYADDKVIFNQSKIRIFKERFGKELEFTYNFVKGVLKFVGSASIETAQKEDADEEKAKKAALYG